ncbi:MAG: DUF58 domain-containing protein [Deltaproteobacteria bacterium]|nr:DUF58 domain-containing protein [Deltaproteobacteria bacterium]MBW2531066.1 DUF58 domain-containing protein [Deltaproteobacteria bacterium]
MKLAKLNHILIPPTKAGRDRFRRAWYGRLLRPLGSLYGAFSAEGRVMAVLLMFLGFVSLEVYGTRVYLLWSAVVGLFVATLVARWAYRLADVRLEVEVPRRVTRGAPTRFGVVVHNRGAEDQVALRVSGPFLPWDGRWLGAQPVFPSVRAGATVRGEAEACFVERGEHHLDPFAIASLVPLGLAVGPPVEGAGSRFLVVPRVAPVEHIDLPLGDRYQPGGVAQASRTGEAMELWGVRPYRRGDAVRDLHALTWARTGVPHVREYRQEYFSRVGVILDNDRLVTTDDGLEAAVSLAAGVVACLSRGETLIDLLVVDGQVHPLTLGRSLGYLEQALDLLACVQLGAKLEPANLVRRLEPHLDRLSAVVLVTEAGSGSERGGPERRELCELLAARGLGCRVLRVARRRGREAKADDGETLTFAQVHGEAPLRL